MSNRPTARKNPAAISCERISLSHDRANYTPVNTHRSTRYTCSLASSFPADVRARIHFLPEDFRFMADLEARQKAEDHYYAALDLVSEGEHERAVSEYQRSLEADPTFTEAMHGMARALLDLGRLDEAIAVAKRISEIDPDDVLAYTSLSVLYQKKGMIPEAEAEGAKARVLGWKQQLKKGS